MKSKTKYVTWKNKLYVFPSQAIALQWIDNDPEKKIIKLDEARRLFGEKIIDQRRSVCLLEAKEAFKYAYQLYDLEENCALPSVYMLKGSAQKLAADKDKEAGKLRYIIKQVKVYG